MRILQKIERTIWLIIALLLCSTSLFISSCNTTKYLQEEEAFLTKNNIEFEKGLKIKDRNELSYELTTLYKQRPNENIFGIPGFSKRALWYKFNGPEDTTKIKKWIVRKLSEKPAVFEDEIAYQTAETMKFYLQNKGYFNANVYHIKSRIGRKGKKVEVTYHIKTNNRYLMDTVRFFSPDPAVEQILQNIRNESLLKTGKPVDGRLYSQEVRRITNYMRNHGYAYFYPTYVDELRGDSTNYRVNVDLNVSPPSYDTVHHTFNVGAVHVYPNYDPLYPPDDYRDTLINGIRFFLKDSAYVKIDPAVLIANIFFQPGDLYRQNDFDKTKRQLGDLGVFKSVTISEVKNENLPKVLNFNVLLTTDQRYEVGWNAEINTSNSPYIDAQLLGVGAGVQLKHRNLLGGAELLAFNADASTDFNVRNLDSLINSVDLKFQTDLYLPKFVDYFGLWRGLNKANIVSDNFYRQLYEKSSSRISGTYNFNKRIGFYTINFFNASFGYEIPPTQTQRFSINHIGIDLFQPTTEFAFDTILAQNTFLERSFDDQLFTGAILRNISYTYNSGVNRLGESVSVLGSAEFSGTEIFAANKLYNAIQNVQDTFQIIGQDTTEFSQYARFDFETRVYRQLSSKQRLAFRFYSGIVLPFGYSTDAPYVKQFFVGGPNSVRAYSAREVGPGGNITDDLINNTNPLLFYQTGDFKLELNAEYRFLIFTLFGAKYEGAVFLDIGNVWTLKYDEERELSQLSWRPEYELQNGINVKIRDNFLNQMAVGTGFGLRMDFSFFLLRFDGGFPLRTPYVLTDEATAEPYNWRRIKDYNYQDFNINIGLGYPF